MARSGGEQPTRLFHEAQSAGAQRVLDVLTERAEDLASMIAEAVREQVPAFAASFSADGFRRDVAASIDMGRQLADGSLEGVEGPRLLSKVGAKHARTGLSLEDSVRAWQVALRVVVQYARGVAGELGISDADAAETVDILLLTIESVQGLVAGAHRETELALERVSSEDRTAFVTALLTGQAGVSARAQASAYGLDPSREYVAVRIACGDVARLDRIAARVTQGAEQRGATGACVPIGGHLGAILTVAPPDFDGAVIGVGPARPLEHLHQSFAMATRAVHAAEAFGVEGTHTFDELALEAAVVADPTISSILVSRHLGPLGDNAIANELLDTVSAYLDTGLNVEQTAGRLIVHQNTVRYRLARFEELSGARLRDPRTQFEIWWALHARAMSIRTS